MNALKKITVVSLLLLLLFIRPVFAIAPPGLEPIAPSCDEQALMDEAVRLHDQGMYDDAIYEYRQVLSLNPSNVLAIYELAFTCSAKKDHENCLKWAQRGVRYKSEYLHSFYLLIATSYDDLGKPQEAIAMYQEGLKLFPDDEPLHFNLAVTYWRLGLNAETRESLKRALDLNPIRPTTHLLFAKLSLEEGEREIALLASGRALVLQPQAAEAIEIFRAALGSALLPAEELDVNVEERLFLSRIYRMSGQPTGGKHDPFLWSYYLPYFTEMRVKDYVDVFINYAFQTANPACAEWLQENKEKVEQFLKWSGNYRWPSAGSNETNGSQASQGR